MTDHGTYRCLAAVALIFVVRLVLVAFAVDRRNEFVARYARGLAATAKVNTVTGMYIRGLADEGEMDAAEDEWLAALELGRGWSTYREDLD